MMIASDSSVCGCSVGAPEAGDSEVEPAKTRFSCLSSTSQMVTESAWKISEIRVDGGLAKVRLFDPRGNAFGSVLQTVR